MSKTRILSCGPHYIINPTCHIKSKYYINLIPHKVAGKLSIRLPEQIKSLDIQNIKGKHDSHKLDNMNEIAHSFDEVQGMIGDEIFEQSG